MTAPRSRAVVERRINPVDDLDLFPTPPWATRALFEALGWDRKLNGGDVWEPACGLGHMSDVIREYAGWVRASDVHDYGIGAEVGSFIGVGPDVLPPAAHDWIITNPPFNQAEAFLARALREARFGVALLMRTAWIEGQGRWKRIFCGTAPDAMLQFADRVSMVKGCWDPSANVPTSYAWFVWMAPFDRCVSTNLQWVPAGAPARLSRPDDVARFAGRRAPDAS